MTLVECSFLQIYNDKIFDLLNLTHNRKSNFEDASGLALKMDKNGQFQVFGLTNAPCEDASNAISHFYRGIKGRKVASHNLNSTSSRSHTVFSL